MPVNMPVGALSSETDPFRPCLVIPVFDHERGLAPLLARLKPLGLHCILVDDGSGATCREALTGVQAREADWVELLRHPVNLGKGAAVQSGLRAAARRGFSHAVQVDADGQHRAEDVPRFLEAARATPQALIAGCAVFDDSVPLARRLGRCATHLWVWINTLSLAIRDGLCGFRVYPVAATLALAESVALGARMEFDAEVAVRLCWAGVPVVNLRTPVIYPSDGVSHFRLWRDNVRISRMHARLFVGMLRRLPRLLRRRRWGR
jgi:glycosyltransferase involved in cell wall biosynthesis